MVLNILGQLASLPQQRLHCVPMIGKPMTPATTPLGRALQELMERRGIETVSELGLRLRRAGYRHIYRSAISQWMIGASRPKSIPRLCFYLDKALTLTEDEKANIASALGLAKYPLPPQPSEERRLFWSASSLTHHGKLL
jgi:hypothetical protein